MNIQEKSIVGVSYDLYVGEESQPELMEQAPEEAPLVFCFGVGMMLDKFEENLSGKKVGDNFDFIIPYTEAYGEYDDANVLDLPKNIFEVDGKIDEDMLSEGNMVPLVDTDGNRINAMVVSVGEDTVTVDLNHPLAGENLHFKGKVVEVREATAEELEMFTNPYGGGCGGGCGDCESDCSSPEEMEDTSCSACGGH